MYLLVIQVLHYWHRHLYRNLRNLYSLFPFTMFRRIKRTSLHCMLERFNTFTIIIAKAIHILLLITYVVFVTALPDNPYGCGYTDRGVRTTSKADDHTKCKVLRCIPTKHIKRYAGKHNSCQCIEATMNTLCNRGICKVCKCIRTFMGMCIFTNAVKDNYRLIHRITYNGQYSCQKGCINFQLEIREYTKYHNQIMKNRNQGRDSYFIFKSIRNINR